MHVCVCVCVCPLKDGVQSIQMCITCYNICPHWKASTYRLTMDESQLIHMATAAGLATAHSVLSVYPVFQHIYDCGSFYDFIFVLQIMKSRWMIGKTLILKSSPQKIVPGVESQLWDAQLTSPSRLISRKFHSNGGCGPFSAILLHAHIVWGWTFRKLFRKYLLCPP